ncbi:MAG: carboxymuconolactone decarboxylase family protein [Alphaproteobacteria bacterium]|nr:carboxymuconolactone decarboxylase family protein [Alphaproteobacteria bacterium]MDP6565886.1 carboxymuconolactone decarboxylase family protein [Alphaproteobacteria bacterium]MDP6813726.1 carboxymuconolactone decarboxylase family protein [Alphaproteobacteria bacterium]
MDKELYETGLRIRKKVLGDEYVDRAIENATDFNRHFQELVTEYCWGGVWGSDGLPDRTRSMLNLAMLAALNRPQEFEIHFRGALKNGCTLDELRDVLEQITIYCGVPAGVEAFRIARRVLDEQEAA